MANWTQVKEPQWKAVERKTYGRAYLPSRCISVSKTGFYVTRALWREVLRLHPGTIGFVPMSDGNGRIGFKPTKKLAKLALKASKNRDGAVTLSGLGTLKALDMKHIIGKKFNPDWVGDILAINTTAPLVQQGG